MNIVVYPNAKINIGLRVIERRDDGFHNIETLFYPIPVCDILEIVESDSLGINYYGIPFLLPDNSIENDLCIRAYRLLQQDYHLPPVTIHLYKKIPVGAGLGGGSSDAAFTLKALNTLFSLNLSTSQLASYAETLGSDCPFFIYNRAMFGEGKGEILSPFDVPLSDYDIRVVTPNIKISTGEAYSHIVPDKSGQGLKKLLKLPVEQWRCRIINDFETVMFERHTVLFAEKEKMYSDGAVYASMSGSGPSIYGIFSRQARP